MQGKGYSLKHTLFEKNHGITSSWPRQQKMTYTTIIFFLTGNNSIFSILVQNVGR